MRPGVRALFFLVNVSTACLTQIAAALREIETCRQRENLLLPNADVARIATEPSQRDDLIPRRKPVRRWSERGNLACHLVSHDAHGGFGASG